MIDITGVDIREFIRAVYRLSRPQGLGYFHYQEGEIPEETLNEIMARYEYAKDKSPYVLRMDYENGRACKMSVFKENDKLLIRELWYDHSIAQLDELLASLGLEKKIIPDEDDN